MFLRARTTQVFRKNENNIAKVGNLMNFKQWIQQFTANSLHDSDFAHDVAAYNDTLQKQIATTKYMNTLQVEEHLTAC